jgi:hypothetical protein
MKENLDNLIATWCGRFDCKHSMCKVSIDYANDMFVVILEAYNGPHCISLISRDYLSVNECVFDLIDKISVR